MKRFHPALLLFAAIAGTPRADAAVFTVGYGPGCTHAGIQAAIDAAAANGPDEDEIRVVANEYTLQRLIIANQSLTLTGGWNSCAPDASVVGTTGLVGGFQAGTPGTNAVLRVQAGDTAIHTVTVRRFELRDGSGGADGNGGGIDAFGALRLVLGDVSITGNRVSGAGGGIFLRGPSTGSFGGILELDPGVNIHANSADLSGGGIHLERASARIRADRTAITGNRALYGGGLHAKASSISIGFGGGDSDPQTGASGHRIAGNRAQVGGGVYLENGSLFDANELQLEGNIASQLGGGLYAIGASQVQIQRDYPNAFKVECMGNACSRIASNQAGNGCPGSDGFGGGLYLDGNSRAYVRQTEIVDNCAYGSPAIQSWGPVLDLEGVVVAGNRLRWRDGADYTGRAAIGYASRTGGPDSFARLAFTTLAGNVEVRDDGTTSPVNAMSQLSNFGAWTFSLNGLVTADPVPGAVTSFGACNRQNVALSSFADAAGGDFRPRIGGGLVDACAAAEAAYEFRDPQLVTRCVDHPQQPDQGGSCDIGAYEAVYVAPADRLFANGFEATPVP